MFFWITVGLLALLFVGGLVAAVFLVFQAESINRSGGWGWILVIGIAVVAVAVVSLLCAIFTTVSLFRRERHRRLSIAMLIISGLVVSVIGPNLIRAANGLRHQYKEASRPSVGASRASAESHPTVTTPSASETASSAPSAREVENARLLELKSKLWEAIRANDAAAFLDCFHFEERFNTPENREENQKQIEILLRSETIDVEIRNIPDKEVVEIMKIQHAKPASQVRYSLFPRMMLRVVQQVQNGRVGRSFLIGEKNGKWSIITLAGHTT